MSTAPDIAQRTAASSIDVSFADCWITPAAQAAAQRVLASGWVTTGTESQAFEAEFAAYVGAGQAVTVSSCTAAIELALRSMRLDRDSLVLTSTMTFCGAVHAIEHAGLRPVLVDVDPETGMPTPETVARAVEGCERRPAAMVLVHWAGDPLDLGPLAAAAGIPTDRVVEDAAHGLGSSWDGATVGTGSAVCFSFYATKNLPVGEGGMVTTDDPDRAAWIRRTRLHGMSQDAWRRYLPGGSWRYDVAESGLKANMSDLSAAIGRAQLEALPQWQDRRALLAARYDALLGERARGPAPAPSRPGTGPARLAPVRRTGRGGPLARRRRPGTGRARRRHLRPLHSRAPAQSLLGAGPTGRPARCGPDVRPTSVSTPLPAADH